MITQISKQKKTFIYNTGFDPLDSPFITINCIGLNTLYLWVNTNLQNPAPNSKVLVKGKFIDQLIPLYLHTGDGKYIESIDSTQTSKLLKVNVEPYDSIQFELDQQPASPSSVTIKAFITEDITFTNNQDNNLLRDIIDRSTPRYTISPRTLKNTSAQNLKSSAGRVYSLSVINDSNTIKYLQIINKATTPVNNDNSLIVDVFAVPPNSTIVIDNTYYHTGLLCSDGVSWALSTTPTTVNLAPATDSLVSIGYS